MTDVSSAAASLRERLRRLPKTELHLHALGAMRPGTIVDLARRAGAPILEAAERAASEGFAFRDLSAFVAFFLGLFEIVRTGEAFERVTREVLEDAAHDGARYAELRFTPTSHLSRGADERTMFEAIEAGRRAAAGTRGIDSRLVLDFPRTLPVEVADATLAVALRQRGRGVTGIDIAGDEMAVAAAPRFAPLFAAARREGLHVTAHAGEAAGPESVRGALDLYGARRVGHGTSAAEDPALLRRLAAEGVVLEVCPSSNVALGVVDAIAAHPLPRFLEAGVPCVVSTDDPTLFGTTLVGEYERLHLEAGVSISSLAELAATGFEAAFVEPGPGGDPLRARLADLARQARAWGRDG